MTRAQQVGGWPTAPSIALCNEFVPGIESLALGVEEALGSLIRSEVAITVPSNRRKQLNMCEKDEVEKSLADMGHTSKLARP